VVISGSNYVIGGQVFGNRTRESRCAAWHPVCSPKAALPTVFAPATRAVPAPVRPAPHPRYARVGPQRFSRMAAGIALVEPGFQTAFWAASLAALSLPMASGGACSWGNT
jgi:hypothetical protein